MFPLFASLQGGIQPINGDIVGILLGYSGEMIASNLAAWWFQGFGWVPTKGTQVTTVTAMVRGMFEATKQVTTHIEVHNLS